MTDEEYGLANWPPSRGPEPKRPKPQYVWPEPKIEPPVEPDSGFEEAYEFDFQDPPEDDGRALDRALDEDFGSGKLVSMSRFREARDAVRYLAISTNVRVADLIDVTPLVADRLVSGYDTHVGSLVGFLPERSIKTRISYPLSKVAVVTVEPYTIRRVYREKVGEHQWMTIGWYLWALAKAYEKIYDDWETWGVWGHAIGDLVFERVIIKDAQAWIEVGS